MAVGSRLAASLDCAAHPDIVPADPSSAPFPLVAALIVPGPDVVLSDVMTNPLRTGLLTTLREQAETRGDAGEPMAQFRVLGSQLRGLEVPPERAPSMVDEHLVLAVAAAYAEGTTIMCGLQEPRVKESDRLEAAAAMLRVNGVTLRIAGSDLIVLVAGTFRAAARMPTTWITGSRCRPW